MKCFYYDNNHKCDQCTEFSLGLFQRNDDNHSCPALWTHERMEVKVCMRVSGGLMTITHIVSRLLVFDMA